MAMPGMIASRGSEKKASRPPLAITPSDTSGNCSPRPRNDSVASARMIRANSSTASVTSADVRLGRMCLNITRRGLQPITSAASTYGRSFADSTMPRVIRA